MFLCIIDLKFYPKTNQIVVKVKNDEVKFDLDVKVMLICHWSLPFVYWIVLVDIFTYPDFTLPKGVFFSE